MFRLVTLSVALLSPVVLTTSVAAQGLVERERQRDARHDRGSVSLDEAVQMAQRRYNARAVKAEIASDGDRRVYVIRLLNDSGRVWTVRVDAETGRMR